MKKLFIVWLITLALPGSVLIAQESAPITISFKKSDLEGNDIKLSAVADEISYIKLETHPDALIGSAGRYSVEKIPSGYLIWNVYGSGKIMLFDEKGNFHGFAGKEGKGPGEYSGVYKVCYDKYFSNILVLMNNRILKYNINGDFIKSVDLERDIGRIESMCVKDDKTWLFTYKIPIKEQLFEVGILATDKEGKLIKKYNLTDENSPGCYSYHTQLNKVYQRTDGTYYVPYDFYHTYKLNEEDEWELFVKIDAPFKKVPIDLFKVHNPIKLNEVQRENGFILSAMIYGKIMRIHGATPQVFTILADLENGEKKYYSYDKKFRTPGLTNDLDGGVPFFFRGFDNSGISIEMIDAVNLLDYYQKRLLNPDGKDHGPYMNLKEVLESSKPEDNPILVVVHVKHTAVF